MADIRFDLSNGIQGEVTSYDFDCLIVPLNIRVNSEICPPRLVADSQATLSYLAVIPVHSRSGQIQQETYLAIWVMFA